MRLRRELHGRAGGLRPGSAVADASDSAVTISRAGADSADTSALLNLLPHVLQTLKREPALAITFAYLFVAMAGIFYNFSFYEKFGIPVLTLSQISDFLVAGIQQPMALVLVLSTFPICWLFDRINLRSRRKHIAERERLRAVQELSLWQRARLVFLDWRVEQRWYTQLSYVAVVVIYGWTFVALYAQYRAAAVKRGEAAEVRVWLNGEPQALASGKSQAWTYLGSVANYVFVYDREGRRAEVLPVNAIARIEPAAPPESASPHRAVAPIP
jgi:hypothetical protein